MIRARMAAALAGLSILAVAVSLASGGVGGSANAQAPAATAPVASPSVAPPSAAPPSAAPQGRPQHLATESLVVHTAHGPQAFKVQFADSEQTREIGLMFRKDMPSDEGMIFEFFQPQPVAFWMRNTILPLDIIFISGDGHILNVAANARPFDETPLPSAGDARAVLEINAGLATRLGIKAGDKITDARIFHP